jgi:hypothetical protein
MAEFCVFKTEIKLYFKKNKHKYRRKLACNIKMTICEHSGLQCGNKE